jgi:hypothetical protein
MEMSITGVASKSLAVTAALNVCFEQDGSQVAVPLESWLSWTNEILSRVTDDTSQLKQLVGNLTGEIDAARQAQATIRQLAARVDSSDRRATEVDSRLNEILAVLDQFAVGGRNSEADIDHYAFQRAFASLVNQQVGAIVDLIVGHLALSRRECATLTSRICWILFGPSEPTEPAFLRAVGLLREADAGWPEVWDRAAQVIEAARALRVRMADHPGQHWEFGFLVGSGLDEEMQEEWSPEPGSGPVEFVVVPAYVIGGNSILSKQRVYCGRPDPVDPVRKERR